MSRTPAIERLIFFHIGRTGGTTLRAEVLYKCADLASVFFIGKDSPTVRGGTVEELFALPRKEQEKLRVVVGHMPFGLRDRLPWPESWHYITLLRDPVARAVSDYYQMRSGPNPAKPFALQYSLEEFVRTKKVSQNRMCHLLSNQASGLRFESEQAMLDEAVRNGEACSFLGLTEYYDESVRRLCRMCGWKVPKYQPRYSLTPKGRVLSASEREALCAANLLDQKLYDHFRERFLQQPMEKPSLRSSLLSNLLNLWPRRRPNKVA